MSKTDELCWCGHQKQAHVDMDSLVKMGLGGCSECGHGSYMCYGFDPTLSLVPRAQHDAAMECCRMLAAGPPSIDSADELKEFAKQQILLADWQEKVMTLAKEAVG